ncbi:unnamed protein product [Acanthoscelides obtectus]|uniref:HTH psq-type domain-containing protein n=1 Tax=Acanthoscelides obtectus TaxID=200917 RepID=A0A9P0K3L7_ACAOB|nr:unnamed protein product [Acanthoscelides obtectus]CAK1648610.1 hypothetical protein AOBTE_LOCUS15782 [Acanthoscelides obtectus]
MSHLLAKSTAWSVYGEKYPVCRFLKGYSGRLYDFAYRWCNIDLSTETENMIVFIFRHSNLEQRKQTFPHHVSAASVRHMLQLMTRKLWRAVLPRLRRDSLVMGNKRKYHKRNLIKLWKKEDVTLALQAVLEKTKRLKKAAKQLNVPRIILQRLLHQCKNEVRLWRRANQEPLTQFDLAELLSKAYVNSQTAEIAINGFKVTGGWPFNRDIFKHADFIEEKENIVNNYRLSFCEADVQYSDVDLSASQPDKELLTRSLDVPDCQPGCSRDTEPQPGWLNTLYLPIRCSNDPAINRDNIICPFASD